MQKDARERYQNLFDEEKCKNRKQTNKQINKTRERCQNFTEEEKNVNIILKVMKVSLTIKNKNLSSIEEIIT